MELSPKGSVFGEGLSRKRTVQEATPHLMRGFYNSSDPGREKTIGHGARVTRNGCSNAASGTTLGVKQAPLLVHRAVDGDTVFESRFIVFVAMPGRGMYGAGALLERDVLRQNAA